MSFSDDFSPTVQKNIFQIFTRDNTTKQYLYNIKIIRPDVSGGGAKKLNLQGEATLQYTQTTINSEGETEAPPTLSVTSGLIARYTPSSFNSGTQVWEDTVGSYDASVYSGTVATKTSSAAGSYTVLYGSTSDSIRFPSGILPTPFTLFHISRYSGATKRRIITSHNVNWLDGHWNGNAGVAYHNGWVTPQTNIHSDNFFISSSQYNLYRSEGTTRGTSGAGGSNPILGVNSHGETSDWEVIEIIVYNRELSISEIESVESYLASIYPDATAVEGTSLAYNVGTSTISDNIYEYDSAEQRINSISALYSTDIFRADIAPKATYVDADLSSGGGGGEVVEANKERWIAWT